MKNKVFHICVRVILALMLPQNAVAAADTKVMDAIRVRERLMGYKPVPPSDETVNVTPEKLNVTTSVDIGVKKAGSAGAVPPQKFSISTAFDRRSPTIDKRV